MPVPRNTFFPAVTAVFLFILALSFPLAGQPRNVTFKINLRGVYDSEITLMALSPSGRFAPVIETKPFRPGEDILLNLSSSYLPGEFVIRFDYRVKPADNPYPAEKTVFIGYQDIELSVNPPFSNNPDSTYFQAGEIENAAWSRFSSENKSRKDKLSVLQYFLMNYDEPDSKFFNQGLEEYEKRRNEYNQWLASSARDHSGLFIRSLIGFEYVPSVILRGTEKERLFSLIHHYFDGIDFHDTLIIRNSIINQWMDAYVNLHGQMVTTVALRDSLFPAAGVFAIEKARTGHPKVYGWMVDYFYRGYEANGIDAGIKILEPYLDDPNCLTSKRMEISRRLEGIRTLVAGTTAPEIDLAASDGTAFKLSSHQPETPYILLVFWSADCSHCAELIDQLYPWQQQETNRKKLSVVAISLDETETETEAWKQKIPLLKGWTHLNAPNGVNSKAASDYFVLATPVLVLIDSGTRKIVSLPASMTEIESSLR
jgi:thiol-disulfide isomerase/thioredoxin